MLAFLTCVAINDRRLRRNIERVTFAQRDALNSNMSLRNVRHMCALRAYRAANRAGKSRAVLRRASLSSFTGPSDAFVMHALPSMRFPALQ